MKSIYPVALALFVAFALSACVHEIGDGCITDTECDRNHVCDTTSPGGYCIEYDCTSDGCDPEAVCVEFQAEGDLLITACMRHCESDKDCRQRDGYICRDDVGSVPFCGIEPLGFE